MNADERRSIGFADGARARCRLCGHQHPDFSDIVTVGASTEGRFSTIGEAISGPDRKSTRLNSSHLGISYAVFCLKKEEHTSELQSLRHLVCRLRLVRSIGSCTPGSNVG